MSLAVVLVRPEIPENAGFVARVLDCYRLEDLRVVGCARYAKSSPAYRTGAMSAGILDGARFSPQLDEALGDCDTAVGFTRRARGDAMRIEPWVPMAPSLDYSGKVALVFGPERAGLTRDECLRLDKLARIDAPHPALSFNLSHAVALALHEIFAHAPLSNNPLRTRGDGAVRGESPLEALEKRAGGAGGRPGSRKHREGRPEGARGPASGPANPTGARADSLRMRREAVFHALKAALSARGALTGVKGQARERYLRGIWNRLQLDAGELDFIRGLLE